MKLTQLKLTNYRNCTDLKIDFDKSKISTAILKAMKNGSGIVKPKIAEDIADEIENECKDKECLFRFFGTVDKGFVYFQILKRKLNHIGKIGIACAEIVHIEFNAEVSKFVHHPFDMAEIIYDNAFGDLYS